MSSRGARVSLWSPLILAILLIAGCGSNPPAPFDVSIAASVVEGVAPLEVEFTATLVGGKEPVAFSWNFGDGSAASAEQNPRHTYAEEGEFTAVLTATDGNETVVTKEIEISVIAPLEVLVGADPEEGVLPLLVNFSATVGGGFEPYTYSWDFGDGQGSDRASPSHLFQVGGTFNVVLNVTDAQNNTGSGEITVTVRDDHVPVAAITANPTVGVAPLEVSFSGSAVGGDAPFTYAWTFGDGGTADTQTATHTFQNPGTYTVVLVITDADGDQGTDTVEIQVGSNEIPVVEIDADVASGIEPLTVHFNAQVAGGNAPLAYSWDLDGDGAEDSSIASPSFTYAAGDYTVTVTVTDANGDTDSDSLDISVQTDTLPEVDAVAVPESGMAPLAVQFDCQATGINLPYVYRWDFGDGQTSTLQAPAYTYTQPGTYVATCTVTDEDGDRDSDTVSVEAIADQLPTAVINANPLVGVAPLDVSFHASVVGGDAPFTYAWDFGDGGSAATQDASHTFAEGTFNVILVVTDDDGDQATASVEIKVTTNEAPVAQISAVPTSGVEPLLVRFTANVAGGNPPLTYAWDFDNGQTSSLPNPTANFAAGSYDVSLTVTDSDGDLATDTLTIDVAADTLPVVTATATPDAGLAPLAVTFTCSVTGGNAPLSYLWDFGNGQTSTLQNPSYTYTQAGQYLATCTVTDVDGDVASGTAQVMVDADLTPAVDVSASPTSGLAPLTVAFTSQVTSGNPPFTYAWVFGDGGTANTANPSHAYAAAGTFQATLVVTDNDGDTAQDLVVISVGDATTPAVTVTATPESGPAPLLVAFTCGATGGNPPYTYRWDFGDGTNSNTQNPSHTFTAIGTYLATCTVTDSFGQPGQGVIQIQAQNPNQAPVIDDLAVNNNWPLPIPQECAAVNQTMFMLRVDAHDPNGDPLAYEWTFENIPPASEVAFNNPNVVNPTFTPDMMGTYRVRVFVRDGRGGQASAFLDLTAELGGQVVADSPVPAPAGTAGDSYFETLRARVLTPCGVPYRNGYVEWRANNGRYDWYSNSSDVDGYVEAGVVLGCNVAVPAEFIAGIPGDSDEAVFSVPVGVGPAYLLLIETELDVPVVDASCNPTPMDVTVSVADRCGNPITSGAEEVEFDIFVNNGACFNDLCPFSGGTGTQELYTQTTTNGVASFQVYDRWTEWIDVWAQPRTPGIQWTGGWRVAESWIRNFENDTNGFREEPWGMWIDWEWGVPSVGAGSGERAWATVLDGNYHDSPGMMDIRPVTTDMNIPCPGIPGTPIQLIFKEYHQIGPNALAYVSLWDPYGDPLPPNAGSDYNGELDGREGYVGESLGWREVSFDLTNWQCQWARFYWNLYLNDATSPAYGWAIDDVYVRYFDWRANGSFGPGDLYNADLWTASNGVANCPTGPGSVWVYTYDCFWNQVHSPTVQLTTTGTGTREFTEADPGVILSQSNGNADVRLGYWGDSRVYFTDTAGENVTVSLTVPAGDRQTMVNFVANTPNEVGLCSDGTDNDCDGQVDCQDSDCASDPWCRPDFWPWDHYARFNGSSIDYDFSWINWSEMDAWGHYAVGVWLLPSGSPQPDPMIQPPMWISDQWDLMSYEQRGYHLDLGNPGPGDWDVWFYVDVFSEIPERDEWNISWPVWVNVSAQYEADDWGNCLDYQDNDGDGLYNCEDTTTSAAYTPCSSDWSWTCQSRVDEDFFGGFDERCNGRDDFGMGYPDMFACNCVFDDNRDCDNIGGPGLPYRCYVEFSWWGVPIPPVCGPPCNMFDPPELLCQIISRGALNNCDMGSGMCMP